MAATDTPATTWSTQTTQCATVSVLLLFLFFGTRHVALIKPKMKSASFDTHFSIFLLSPCAPLASFGFCCCCFCVAPGKKASTISVCRPLCCVCRCWYLSCLLLLNICVASLRVTDDGIANDFAELLLPLMLSLLP